MHDLGIDYKINSNYLTYSPGLNRHFFIAGIFYLHIMSLIFNDSIKVCFSTIYNVHVKNN